MGPRPSSEKFLLQVSERRNAVGTQGIYAPRGLSTGAPAVVKAAQGGRSGDALCPNVKKNKVLLASPWGGKLPACLQLARTPCTFSPQFHTRVEVVQLPSQCPLPSRHCCERLQVAVCYTSALRPYEKTSKQGSKLRSGNTSGLGKC